MGAEPVIADYCREIEAYLCRKNDGHLIRVVGPSFDLVSAWASRGVPLKVAFEGIDRYFERYYRSGSRSGPRRRPVKIDFCEADVLDVFDEWRRAIGIASSSQLLALDPEPPASSSQPPGSSLQPPGSSLQPPASRSEPRAASRESLPEHLERIVTRLTSRRASGVLNEMFDELIDRASHELDLARAKTGGVRGEARASLLARLTDLDADLMRAARAQLDANELATIAREADDELAPFRAGMQPDAFARARDAAIDRLVRARFNLPIASFDG